MRAGYKQTEVGVIPEDWSLRQLGDVVTFLDGRRRPVKDADRAKMRGSIPYYGASGIVDYVNDYLFDEDLILLGEDGENILSRNCRLAFRISGKAWVNNHAHVLKPDPDVSIGFLTDYLESLNYERFNSGTAQPKLNKQTCFGIPVALPPTKAEQEAIAEALSNADAHIESLERLVVKTRLLKKGAMQELLTGKKRLAGFSGEWEAARLEELGNCFAGGTPSTTRPDYWGGDILWLPSGRVQNRIIPKPLETEATITKRGLDESAAKLIKARSVLVAITGATCANVASLEFEAAANQSVVAIEPLDTVNYRFLYYSLLMERNTILSLQSGSAQGGVNLKAVKSIPLKVPPFSEQTGIATILSDMDAEITALEARLAKACQFKQGMMQELLTGRIRLL